MAASSPSRSAPSTWPCGTSPAASPACLCTALLGGKRRSKRPRRVLDHLRHRQPGRARAAVRRPARPGLPGAEGRLGHDLSIAFGRDPKRDLAIVRTVREAVGDDAEIIVDVAAGSGWTASHAITMARAFEPYRLYWLEDALIEGDLDGWRRLRAATATPLCTGEKGWTIPDFREAHRQSRAGCGDDRPRPRRRRHRHQEGDRHGGRRRHLLERPLLVERAQHRRLAASGGGIVQRPHPGAEARCPRRCRTTSSAIPSSCATAGSKSATRPGSASPSMKPRCAGLHSTELFSFTRIGHFSSPHGEP